MWPCCCLVDQWMTRAISCMGCIISAIKRFANILSIDIIWWGWKWSDRVKIGRVTGPSQAVHTELNFFDDTNETLLFLKEELELLCCWETTEERTREAQAPYAKGNFAGRWPASSPIERSKLQNRRQREKEASFRGTNWTLCRTTEPTRQRENFFPLSASKKKKELSERKAREQRSAVSFLAVGETCSI